MPVLAVQVVRILPYSAVQLFSYEFFKVTASHITKPVLRSTNPRFDIAYWQASSACRVLVFGASCKPLLL